MDEKTPLEQKQTAGQDFLRKIGPAGCVLFLALFVLVTAICLTAGRDPLPDYEAPHDVSYYVNHLGELAEELNENVLPRLETPSSAAVTGESVTITVQDTTFVVVRSAVLHYFDESLLSFETD